MDLGRADLTGHVVVAVLWLVHELPNAFVEENHPDGTQTWHLQADFYVAMYCSGFGGETLKPYTLDPKP